MARTLALVFGAVLLSSAAGCTLISLPAPTESARDAGGDWNPPTRSDASAPSTADAAVADARASYPDATRASDASQPSVDVVVPPPDPSAPDAGPPDALGACDQITDHTPVTLYLSADDSNSEASPVIARRMIRTEQIVPRSLLRTYEFLNYYNVAYEPADSGTVRVVPQLRPNDAPGGYTLQVGIQSELRPAGQAWPMVITFVLDTSGSMHEDFRIDRERAVVRAIAGQLRRGDVVSAVTWGVAQHAVLRGYVVTGRWDPVLLSMADALTPDGGTDLDSGLAAGYALAEESYRPDALNRVVVISDGQANVGVTNAEVIAEQSHRAEQEEIYLVGVGVGDGFNDTMMDTLTDRGRGAYVFIDSDAEAAKMFGPRFEENMDLAVRAVRLELTLPWYLSVRQFHGEAISTDARAVDPQHLAPNDAMVFHQELAACSPEVVSRDDVIHLRATYEDRVTRAPREQVVDASLGALLDGGDAQLVRGSAIVAYAEALKTAADQHDAGRNADARATLDAARAVVDAANPGGADPDLSEISGLLLVYRARF